MGDLLAVFAHSYPVRAGQKRCKHQQGCKSNWFHRKGWYQELGKTRLFFVK